MATNSFLTMNVISVRELKPTSIDLLNLPRTPIPDKKIYRFTLPVFLERASQKHGNKYDYSKITANDIKTKRSIVPIICNTCGFEFTMSITSHIHRGYGCHACSGNLPWTYERFMQRAREVHGDLYNYDGVTKTHIVNGLSIIPVQCNKCAYMWEPTIHGHINGKHKCPSCVNKVPWTYERFIQKAYEIHGDKFSYEKITLAHIQGVSSIIPLVCNSCGYEWETTIHTHINAKSGCPDCAGLAKWTYERFVQRAQEVHGDKFNYEKILPEHIMGVLAHVPIICNDCGYEWSPSVSNHICGYDCPSCMGTALWTLERFLAAAKVIHGNKFCYERVTADNIRGVNSQVPLICLTCNHIITPTIGSHIRGYGCPHCKLVRGYSVAQIQWLDQIMKHENIDIQHALSLKGEYFIPGVGKVDGYCAQTNTVYEFHGDFWHGNPNRFDSNDVNPVSGKTYGELYQRTLQRDAKISSLGYNVVVKWES